MSAAGKVSEVVVVPRQGVVEVLLLIDRVNTELLAEVINIRES